MVSQYRAGRTEYGVTNDDVEYVEQQSKHVLDLKKKIALEGFVKAYPVGPIPDNL